MRRRLTRLLRVWFALLAVFAAAAAPVQAARAQERPAVVTMLRAERRATVVVPATPPRLEAPARVELEPRVVPQAPRGRLYIDHHALLW